MLHDFDTKICAEADRQEMWEQEKKHLATMDKLQLQHRVRPTLMSDVAKGLGFALGVCTALMGKEAAMGVHRGGRDRS